MLCKHFAFPSSFYYETEVTFFNSSNFPVVQPLTPSYLVVDRALYGCIGHLISLTSEAPCFNGL